MVELWGVRVKYSLIVTSLAQLIIKTDADSTQGQKLHPEYTTYDAKLKYFTWPIHTLKNAHQLLNFCTVDTRKSHSGASRERVCSDPSVNTACVQYNCVDLEGKKRIIYKPLLQMVHGHQAIQATTSSGPQFHDSGCLLI